MADNIRRAYPPPAKCGANAKHSGEPCRRWAIPGSARCRHHGGYAGPHGRPAAEERHQVRRVEALVSAAAAKIMLADGWDPEIVEAVGGRLPVVRPDEQIRPSADFITEQVEQDAIANSLQHMARGLTAQLQEAAVERSSRSAGTFEPDQVAENIELLERRPTSRRMVEAAQLRHAREAVDSALKSQAPASSPAPPPPVEVFVGADKNPQPGKRRTTTTLGLQRGDLR